MAKICTHEGCMNYVFSDGYCQRHQYESTKHMERQKAKRQKKKEEGQVIHKKVVNKNNHTKCKSNKDSYRKGTPPVNELTNKPVPKEYNLSDLISRCDYLFSRYIRQNEKDKNGDVKCYTCGAKHHWKNIQAGHYVPRIVYAVRWDIFNVRPQCDSCNSFKQGNLVIYSSKLLKENPEEMARLLKAKRTIFKLTKSDLVELGRSLEKMLRESGYSYT